MNRRDFITKSSVAMIAASLPMSFAFGSSQVPTGSGVYSSRTRELLEQANVVDMLSGIAQARMINGQPSLDAWLSNPELFTAEDAKDYAAAKLHVYGLGDVLPDSQEEALEWIARWNGFIASKSEFFERIDNKEKLRAAGQSGKIGIMLTTQSAFHFRELDDVNRFYAMGQRVAQLCHNQSNHIATAGFDDNDKGLSDFGAKVVQRMQEIGMAVDVSHCSDKTTNQVLDIAERPVLFTHAPCRALNPGYARAKTDDMIRRMAATGGVMGVAVLRFFARDQEPVTIEHFLDHIDHIVNVAGIDHVGIGSDQSFDTEDQNPYDVRKQTIEGAPAKYKVHSNEHYQIAIEGINHRNRSYDITEGLIRRGYSDKDILKILGGNFVRSLSDCWKS